VLLLLPLLLWQGDAPPTGTARFTLLDVGQGLAAVVQTRRHVLVYDTGPRYPSGFDTGEAVVVPFLREAGLRRIDTLVVSHGGNDHAGGVHSVLQAFPAGRILSSVDPGREPFGQQACRRGQHWRWDGVEFRILHPARDGLSGEENDHSCVLRVRAGEDSLLLTADIEAPAEQSLLRSGQPLQADILVAPHHGSKTSSSERFVAAVRPQAVLYSVGYRNRYGFPHAEVVERYRRLGASRYRTDRSGALRFTLGGGGLVPQAYRREQLRLWHSR
jgi:competence protein ComEC